MKEKDLKQFLVKRGFKVVKITERDYGYLVELKGKVEEAESLFRDIQDTSHVVFTAKVTWWEKLNASIQRSILHRTR